MVGLSVLPACGRQDLSGPPQIRLGRDECAACGMIISDDRCSSALLVEREGRREHVLFDDLGCMLDQERENGVRDRVVQAFVHDYGTGAWSAADSAVFIFGAGDAVRTPMGSGIVAFATQERAEAEQRRSGGEVMGAAALAVARREWMESRYGKPAVPR